MATAIRAPMVSSHARLIVILAGAAIFINYVDRGNIATAGPLIKSELALSNTQFGILVSAFFWSYVPAQLLAGWLSQRFCAYRVLAVGVALWALATVATGFAHGFTAILLLRLLLGLGESAAFPATSKLFADHLPPERFGQGNTATSIGLAIGPAFGIYIGGLLMAASGWRLSFVIFGAASLLWLIPWLAMKRDTPRLHPDSSPAPSLIDVARQPRAWWAALGHFTSNYSFYFMLSWLPLYLVKVHGFSLAQMASLGGVIYLLQGAAATLGGLGADALIARGMTANHARKLVLVSSSALAMASMAAVGLGGVTIAIAALITAGIANGLGSSNIFAAGQTMAGPRASGTWIGFQNFFGNTSGIIGPILTGWLVDHAGGYPAAFAVSAGVSLIGVLTWGILIGRIEQVDWARGT